MSMYDKNHYNKKKKSLVYSFYKPSITPISKLVQRDVFKKYTSISFMNIDFKIINKL